MFRGSSSVQDWAEALRVGHYCKECCEWLTGLEVEEEGGVGTRTDSWGT